MLFGLAFRIRLLQLCRNDTGTFPEINQNFRNSNEFSYALADKQLPSSAVTRAEKFLEEFIEAHGLTWAEFSRVIGYSDRMVRKWTESDELTKNAAAAISDAFIVPLDSILAAANQGVPLPARFRDRVAWKSRIDRKGEHAAIEESAEEQASPPPLKYAPAPADLLKLPHEEQIKILSAAADRNALAAFAASALMAVAQHIENRSTRDRIEGYAEFCGRNLQEEFEKEDRQSRRPPEQKPFSQRQIKRRGA